MKNTLIKYGHDSRLYGGKVDLSDFDTEPSNYTMKDSRVAKQYVSDVMFDYDCKDASKRRNNAKKKMDDTHPWRYGNHL